MRTKVGFTGGTSRNPTYHFLGDHTESVDIEYDPSVISYERLLNMFWKNHSPTYQKSKQYMSAIFCHGEEQLKMAKLSKAAEQKKNSKRIVTEIVLAEQFYDAENYHQKYMLRSHSRLLESLKLSNDEIKNSYVASKLNGFVGGSCSIADFEKEKPRLGLNEDQVDYITRQISGRRR